MKSRFLALAVLGLASSACLLAASDEEKLAQAGTPDLGDPPTAAQIQAELPAALAAPIVTVLDKPLSSPVGDRHEYVSYGRYWWPDPTRPGGLPFVQRDGDANEAQIVQGDEIRLLRLTEAVDVLALGWSELHREDSARRAGQWLRAWLVDPATRMRPDLDYAQVHLGHTRNRGNAAGVLDGRFFASIVRDLQKLSGSPALTRTDEIVVRAWFTDYLRWLLTAPTATAERAAANNHGSWYLVQAVSIARYVGQDDIAYRFCKEDLLRIAHQIRPDGSQPLELSRVDGLSYSAFNLRAQFELAQLARGLGFDLIHYRSPEGGSLMGALNYLRPYNRAPQRWPGREKKPMAPGFLDELIALAAH
jgi:hypothetical protein